MADLETLVIRVKHVSDEKGLAKSKADALKAAQEIEVTIQRTVTKAKKSAAEIEAAKVRAIERAAKKEKTEAERTAAKVKREAEKTAKATARLAKQAEAKRKRSEKAVAREAEKTARVQEREAEKAAKAHEKAASAARQVWTGALRQVGARLTDFGIKGAQAIAGFVADTFTNTRETDLAAQSLGFEGEELMALEKGFARVRVPISATRDAVQTLRENLGELERVGTGPAKDSLGSLGLTLDDFKDKTPTEQLKVFANALMNVQDPMKRTSIALEVLGDEAGRHVTKAMVDGADGIDKLTQAARDAGQVLDQETIEATRELDEALLGVKGQAEGAALKIMQDAIPAMQGWIDENQELLDQGVPAAIEMIGTAAELATTAILTLAIAMKDLRQGGDDSTIGRWILGVQGIELDENGNRVEAGQSQRVAATPEEQAKNNALGNARQRRAELRRGENPGAYGQSDDELDRIAAARAGTLGRIQTHNTKLFEEEELKKAKGTGRKPKKDREKEKREQIETFRQTELGAELDLLGQQVKATPKAIEGALFAAFQSTEQGAAQSVARKAGQGALSGKVGFDVSKRASRDPLSRLFGIEAAPDASVHDVTGGTVPNVLTMTINNTFTIDMPVSIDGSARPDLVPDQVKTAVRQVLGEEIQRESKYAKVGLAR